MTETDIAATFALGVNKCPVPAGYRCREEPEREHGRAGS